MNAFTKTGLGFFILAIITVMLPNWFRPIPPTHKIFPTIVVTNTRTIFRHEPLIMNRRELNCMAQTIYFEAGNQPVAGKLMVGMVVLERLHNPQYPSTVCAVVHQSEHWHGHRVGCQFSWYCYPHKINLHNPIDLNAWKRSMMIAKLVLSRNFYNSITSDNMTNYHATYVHPQWAHSKQFKKYITVGQHVFYLASR